MQAFLKTGKTTGNVEKSQPGTSKESAQRKKPSPPWVEKYRPKCVNDVVEQDEVVQVFRQCLDGADLPNMLLYGPPGTGKTSTILAASRQLFGDLFKERILELNASDERGIAVIRDKVKTFAMRTANSIRPDGKSCPPFKIVILDEADAMTHAAQAALRRTMEKESRTTRFCLICNYVTRIIAPITSRCTKFRFKPLGEEKIIERLKLICATENVRIEDNAYKSIVEISGGDMRRAITTLQSTYRLKGSQGEISVNDILEISGVIPQKYLDDFLGICRSGVFTNLMKFVKNINFEAFTVGQLLDQLNEFIVHHPALTNQEKSIISDKLGECCFKVNDGGSEYLQIMDLACLMILTFSKK